MKNFLSRKARGIAPYVAGEQPKDRQYVKLNTNENPYPPSPKALEAYRNFDFSSLKLYPPLGMEKLRAAIAEAECVAPDHVFCGNGSDEILALCFPAYFDEDGAGAAFADITYSFYPVFCDFFGIPKKIVPLEEDFTLDLRKLAASGAQGLIVANPNAPTGIGIPLPEMEAFVRENSGRVVIIDEAYMPFYGQSAVPLTEKYDNLVVVKTFSKGYSLAGLRCGYARRAAFPAFGAGAQPRLLQFLSRRRRLPGGVRRGDLRRRLLCGNKRARRIRTGEAGAGAARAGLRSAAFLRELPVRPQGRHGGQGGIRGPARPRRARAPFR